MLLSERGGFFLFPPFPTVVKGSSPLPFPAAFPPSSVIARVPGAGSIMIGGRGLDGTTIWKLLPPGGLLEAAAVATAAGAAVAEVAAVSAFAFTNLLL